MLYFGTAFDPSPLFASRRVSVQGIISTLHMGTFSIVAYDAEIEAWGVAIASRALASGAFSLAKAGAGAIVNQSLPDLSAGYMSIDRLEQGMDSEEVLSTMIDIDSTGGALLEPLRAALDEQYGIELKAMRDIRQIGLVDATGNAAAFTGSANIPWAGHIVGDRFTCQGNSLAGSQVLDAMVETYTATSGDFADRLLAALKAGENAGGDTRSDNLRYSAGLLVSKQSLTQYGVHDRFIDLRVDHDNTPINRLMELRAMHRQDFGS